MKRSGFKKKPVAMKRTKLRPRSKKREVLDKEYSQLRKAFLLKYPQCQICFCRPSTDVHHRKKRGVNYLKVETWLASCRSCHRWAHDHPAEAKKRGIIEDSFK